MPTKLVNGERVEMSQAEFDAFEVSRMPSVAERRQTLKGQAREQYAATLAHGFADSNGTRWAATAEAREKTSLLVLRMTAGNGLPNGKPKIRLRDANNVPHDLTGNEIKTLAEQGSDFQDQAEDHLEQLYADIDTAETHADLDAIDVTSGWPE